MFNISLRAAIGSAILWLMLNLPLLDAACGGALLGLLPEAVVRGIDIVLGPVVGLQVGILDSIYGHPFMGIHSSGRILRLLAMQSFALGATAFSILFFYLAACKYAREQKMQ